MATIDSKIFDEYLDAIRAKIPPGQVASFVRNLVGSGDDAEDVDSDNFPGFVYAQRVGKAGIDALLAHGEEINGAWREIRRGRYGFGRAMETTAKVFENYYGVFTAAMYGPDEQPRPSWLVIPFDKRNPPTGKFSTRIASVFPKSTKLDYSNFEAFGAQPAMTRQDPSPYDGPPEVRGSRVYIKLDNEVVEEKLDDGDYVSFIFPQGMGKVPPLAIVVLRVWTSDEDDAENEGQEDGTPSVTAKRRRAKSAKSAKSAKPKKI